MDNANHIERTIKKTFEDVIETGFDAERIQAILHRTELSLKKQVKDVSDFTLN
jgi:Zn-dependent M16 (insulinase) family peptidase